MRIQELGYIIQRARLDRGLTQAALARKAGVSRPTLNLLENGLLPELGIRKVLNLLDALSLDVDVQRKPGRPAPDFVSMACTMASVGFKNPLGEDELIRALLTGALPPGRSPHLRVIFEEAPEEVAQGLVKEARRWMTTQRLRTNLRKLASAVETNREIDLWMKHA